MANPIYIGQSRFRADRRLIAKHVINTKPQQRIAIKICIDSTCNVYKASRNDYFFYDRYRHLYSSDIFLVQYVLYSDSCLGSILHVRQCGEGDTVGLLSQCLEHRQVTHHCFKIKFQFSLIIYLVYIFNHKTFRIVLIRNSDTCS